MLVVKLGILHGLQFGLEAKARIKSSFFINLFGNLLMSLNPHDNEVKSAVPSELPQYSASDSKSIQSPHITVSNHVVLLVPNALFIFLDVF